jgi:RNA polymerase sigma-70 factor (ECF subfamily)
VDNEAAIMAAVLDGDTEAFGELVRSCQARVRLACLTRLGSRAEADDAAQEVFVKAFQALPSFKKESSFLTWILRIAENHCLDLLRTRTRRRTESLEALLEEKGQALEGLLSRHDETSRSVHYSPEDLDLLGRLFAALDENDREILILREVDELSYEDISRRLACSLDAVKGRLKRARQNLIDKCTKYFPDTSPTSGRLI